MKKPKKGAVKRFFAGLLAVILCIAILTVIANVITSSINRSRIDNFKVEPLATSLKPEKDENGYWSFTTDRDFRIMQLTDVHIGGGWMSFGKDKMALNAVAAMVKAEQPDLVVITGDIAYPVPFQAGTFNNKTSATLFADLMESLGVYWTITLGNHDTELYSYFSRESISALYESGKYSHCLFSAGPADVDGYGNHIINIKDSLGSVTKSLVFLDSHSYTDGDYFGIFWKYDNIHQNQIDWYKAQMQKLGEQNWKVAAEVNGFEIKTDKVNYARSLVFCHIPIREYRDAWNEYLKNGKKDTENVKLEYGRVGEKDPYVYCGVGDDNLFETMQECGGEGMFCGHDHLNNFSLNYKGVWLTYGMSVDYLAYRGISKQGAQRGCTMIYSSPSSGGGFYCEQHNYYDDIFTPFYEKEEVTIAPQTNE